MEPRMEHGAFKGLHIPTDDSRFSLPKDPERALPEHLVEYADLASKAERRLEDNIAAGCDLITKATLRASAMVIPETN